MSKDPVLDGLETEMSRALFAWWERLGENAGGLPSEQDVVKLLAALVRGFYLPPEKRSDGSIDLTIRRARLGLGQPFVPDEVLPPVAVTSKLDAGSVVDQDRNVRKRPKRRA